MQKNQTKELKKDLNSFLVKMQKPLVIAMFAIAILTIVYAFIFFTPFYNIYLLDSSLSIEECRQFGIALYQADGTTYTYNSDAYAIKEDIFGDSKLYGLKIEYFSKFTHDIQALNHLLFYIGLSATLITLLLFIYRAQKRKRFYVTNFVTGGIVIAFDLFAGIFSIANLAKWQQICSNQDFNILNIGQSYVNRSYEVIEVEEGVKSFVAKDYYSADTFKGMFTLGYVVYALLIVMALTGLAFYIVKFIYQRKHPAVDISGVIINE